MTKVLKRLTEYFPYLIQYVRLNLAGERIYYIENLLIRK